MLTEQDIARPVVQHLIDLGWDVHQEVEWQGGIADIVAVMGRKVWVVEVKKTLSLELISQVHYRIGYAHWISIAIPVSKKKMESRGRVWARHYLKSIGIGTIEIEHHDGRTPPSYFSVYERHTPSMMKRPIKYSIDGLFDCLCEETKTFAEAGTQHGKRWTPFKVACKAVTIAVNENPGITIKEIIDNCGKFHYHSNSSARSSLYHWITTGLIEGIETRKEGRYLRLYPKETTNV